MKILGEKKISASREEVWEALNSPDILMKCIPGCESMTLVNPDEYAITMHAAIGPVKAKFRGKIVLSEQNPPNAYTISFDGEGGVAGIGRGVAKVELLSDEPEATTLKYTAEAHVGGKLAQLGSRLIDATAKKMSASFFDAFESELNKPESPGSEVAESAAVTETESHTLKPETARTKTVEPDSTPLRATKGGRPPYAWIAAGVTALIVLWVATTN